MNAVTQTAKCVASLFTPSFYKNAFLRIVENNRKDVHNGSIRPFFKGVALTWITGYSITYFMVKRYYVYPKLDAIKKVEEAAHH